VEHLNQSQATGTNSNQEALTSQESDHWKLNLVRQACEDRQMFEPKFGLMVYDTPNIGDDIQTLAALQFMQRVDLLLLRDRIGEPVSGVDWPTASVRMILNGWFMGRQSWPPAPFIRPIFTSFHISQQGYENYGYLVGKDFMLDKKSTDYYAKWGPVGCRDRATQRLLNEVGVENFFSGCLTLTLPRPPVKRGDHVVFVHVNGDTDKLLASTPEHVRNRIKYRYHGVHDLQPGLLPRLERAAALLEEYAAASLVVTSRIHCALPCLAFGTPVLFVYPETDLTRLEGLEDFFRTAKVSDGQILAPERWYEPQANPGTHLSFAKSIAENCRQKLKIRSHGLEMSAPVNPKYEGYEWHEFEYFDETWKYRIQQMAAYIPESASVVDLGCGMQWLKEIRPDLLYTGVDYAKRGSDTEVADFNQYEFPVVKANWAFASGVLEYVQDPKWFIKQICENFTSCVLSYCVTDTHSFRQGRRDWGWVNDLSTVEIEAFFNAHNFELVTKDLTKTSNSIFVFTRR